MSKAAQLIALPQQTGYYLYDYAKIEKETKEKDHYFNGNLTMSIGTGNSSATIA